MIKMYLILVVIVVFAAPTTAQWNIAQTLALGGATVAHSRGVSALHGNPANISLDSNTSLQSTLASFVAQGGNSALSMNDLARYSPSSSAQQPEGSSALRMSNAERDALFDKVSGSNVAGEFLSQNIGVVYSLTNSTTIGFSSAVQAQMNTTVPVDLKSVVDGSFGTRAIHLSFDRASVLVYSALQLSCAQVIDKTVTESLNQTMSLGFTVKRLNGIAYGSLGSKAVLDVTPYIPAGWDSTSNLAIRVDASSLSAGSSSSMSFGNILTSSLTNQNIGYGIDLGFSVQRQTVSTLTQFSVAITDLGFIDWDDLRTTTYAGSDTIVSASTITRQYFDRFAQSVHTANVRRSLAAKLRLGASLAWLDIWGGEHIELCTEMTQGLNSEGSNTTSPRLALGASLSQQGYRPSIQVGLHVGGFDAFALSAGCGWTIWNRLHVDAALGNVLAAIAPGHAHWFSAAFGCTVDL